VYQLVDAARRAGVGAVRPGATVADVHLATTRTIVGGLVDLGVLRGEIDGLLEQTAYKPFFPHQTSHWLGLDVHDPGDYARADVSRTLETGMVLTVEPGLYFAVGGQGQIAPGFEGIGVRIEDDVVVTDQGHELLTADLPTEWSAVEAQVGAAP
jgi:Xaa-Pro aminopeptidase